ncbi:hypothetical protein ACIBTV_07140 [Micromonospora sp. NPDC049366]|uniref:hypothetical protein n=1 Tax=Micromonospora sp. NPDC049366 TaxID=3364271 RepID=UPI003798D7CB
MASLLASVAFTLTLLAPATPAGAHPFGDPQTVAVAADPARPEVVHVRWRAGGLDDLTLLGVHLGLLPADRVTLDGAVFFEPADATVLGPSTQFVDYVLRQMTLTSGGRACVGTVKPPSDLAKSGVTVDYTCPGPVGVARLDLRLLTDLDPGYRALATGPDGQRAVYGPDRRTQDWVLGDAPPASEPHLGRRAAAQIAPIVGGVLLVPVVALLLRRRRRAARTRPSS